MSRHTHCILVHQRADEAAVGVIATLHRIASMHAAGASGLGMNDVQERLAQRKRAAEIEASQIREMMPRKSRIMVASQAPQVFACLAVEPLLLVLAGVPYWVANHLEHGGTLQDLDEQMSRQGIHRDLNRVIEQLHLLGAGPGEGYLMVAHWVCTRPQDSTDTALAARLQPWVAAIRPALVAAAQPVIEASLGRHPNEGWLRDSQAAPQME